MISISKVFLLPGIIFFSCQKDGEIVNKTVVNDSARISITNISPSISSLIFSVDNALVSLRDSPFVYGSTTYETYINNPNSSTLITKNLPYIGIQSGYRQLGFGSVSQSQFYSINNYFQSANSYSIFITDTVKYGHLTSVILHDNMVATDSTEGEIRFLNLSPDAPAFDIWAYPNGGYNGTKIFSSCGYLPNDYNSFVNAEFFLKIPTGQYFFVATVAGTDNIVLQGGLAVPPKSVVTIYTKGYLNGSGANAIDVGVIGYPQ